MDKKPVVDKKSGYITFSYPKEKALDAAAFRDGLKVVAQVKLQGALKRRSITLAADAVEAWCDILSTDAAAVPMPFSKLSKGIDAIEPELPELARKFGTVAQATESQSALRKRFSLLF